MKEKAEINKSLFPFFISYSSNQLVKSSTNYRMWWSRNSQQTSAGLLYGGVTVEECHKMIQKSLQIVYVYIAAPKVKFLMEQMEKSGCPIRSNFIKAVRCKHRAGGFFVPGKGDCVRRRATTSVRANPRCSEAMIKLALKGIWDTCYNTMPFDRAP
ncbi:hypothetical protein Pfo_007670 [Paulownia fortunei]|nr:hypothetical protein Pfo_007670 [Paulownia fortunei]